MRVCGYCGSEIECDGEVLHLPDCTAPVPYGDEDDSEIHESRRPQEDAP